VDYDFEILQWIVVSTVLSQRDRSSSWSAQTTQNEAWFPYQGINIFLNTLLATNGGAVGSEDRYCRVFSDYVISIGNTTSLLDSLMQELSTREFPKRFHFSLRGI
jgi:hypothetical protein